jgi:hypothetical protein
MGIMVYLYFSGAVAVGRRRKERSLERNGRWQKLTVLGFRPCSVMWKGVGKKTIL